MLTEVQTRARLAVTATFITNGLVVGAFVARIPDIKKALDVSNSTLSLCLLASSLGVFAALPVAGKLCAKYGSSPVAFYATLAMVATWTLQSFTFFAVWAFALTAFFAGYTLASQDVAMNSHAVTLEHQSSLRLMSVFHGMFSVGGFGGGILGGLASQLGISYRVQTIFICAAITIIALQVRKFWLPGSDDSHELEPGTKMHRPAIIWLFGIFGLCSTIGEGAVGDWGGVLTRETYGASPFVSAIPYVVFSATMIIGRFSGDRLATRFGAAKVLASGGLIASIGMTTGLVINSTAGAIFGWFWMGAGLSVAIPLLFSAAGSLANSRFAGQIAPAQAVAMVSGISYFGFIVGPPFIGFISDATSLHSAMFVPALLALTIVASARFAKSA
jgi:MFS family permease